MATSVPDTNTFALSDVVAVVGGNSLSAAFTNSTDSYFDPAYKGSKDRLSNFRNYTSILLTDAFFCYELSETSNSHGLTINDATASNNDGYLDNSTGNINMNVTGKLGSGMYNAGDDDGIRSALLSSTVEYTINEWINPQSNTTRNAVWKNGSEMLLVEWAGSPYSSTTMNITLEHLTTYEDTGILISGWNMITIVRNSSHMYLYVNGTLRYDWYSSGFFGTMPSSYLYTGSNLTTTGEMRGYYDQIAFWNRNLSLSEISALYNSGSGLSFTSW